MRFTGNKNILIIGVIILVLLGGGYFLMKGKTLSTQTSNTVVNSVSPTGMMKQPKTTETQIPTESQHTTQTMAVEYNGDGFNPKSITIKAGDTVRWTNKDTDKLWVASNPHPVHTGYPGFDALKGIPTGETYSFTFAKAGKWGYHNHLEPDQQGEIIVE